MSELDVIEEDLKIASKILEWEIGDIWGHVGTRMPSGDGVTLKLFRKPEEEGVEDWIVRFDYSMKKISGVARPPTEAAIYTEIFKARPDVNAIVHCHAPMCIALGLAGTKIDAVHMQSGAFAGGVPIFEKPIFIIDEDEGKELAAAMKQVNAMVLNGHGIVMLGKSIDEVCIRSLYLERTARKSIANTWTRSEDPITTSRNGPITKTRCARANGGAAARRKPFVRMKTRRR
jgi:ribulose-5-phosphate 4-epimerase/fuculose-1-phosphate aldolase